MRNPVKRVKDLNKKDIANLEEAMRDNVAASMMPIIESSSEAPSGQHSFYFEDVIWNPPGSADCILIPRGLKVTYTGLGDLSGTSHIAGPFLNYLSINAPGRTVNLLSVGEDKLDVVSGSTVTYANMGEGNVNNAGTIGLLTQQMHVVTNSGAITTIRAADLNIESNAGTITKATGLNYPDLSGLSGITTKRLFENADPKAHGQTKAMLVSSAWSVTSLTNGQSLTLAQDSQFFVFTQGSTIAGATLTMPVPLLDGQEVLLKTLGAITSLTLNAHAGGNFLSGDAITTLAANASVRYKYYQASNVWVKI